MGVAEAHRPRAGDLLEGVPEYEPATVDRVARRAQIRAIELVHSHFAADDAPFRSTSRESPSFEVGINYEWQLSGDYSQLACVLNFATVFAKDEPPFDVTASFRMLYSLAEPTELTEPAIEQFVWWDAVFTAWPYWREYLASHLSRAGFDNALVSSLPLPRHSD